MRQLFQNSIGDGVTAISNATQRAMLYWTIAIRASLTLFLIPPSPTHLPGCTFIQFTSMDTLL